MKAQTDTTFTVFLKMVTASTDFHTLQHNQRVIDNYENEGRKKKRQLSCRSQKQKTTKTVDETLLITQG